MSRLEGRKYPAQDLPNQSQYRLTPLLPRRRPPFSALSIFIDNELQYYCFNITKRKVN